MHKSKYPSLIEFLTTDTHLVLLDGALKRIDELVDKDLKTINYNQCRKSDSEQLNLSIIVSSSSKSEPPKPPLSRKIRTGVGRFCKNCNSTMSKYGFLRLFGKRYCDNKKCPNSKPEKN